MIQKQFFRECQLFAPEVKHFYHKNTWKNSPSFSENDLKHEINNFGKDCFGRCRSCLYRSNNIFFLYCYWKLRLIVTGSCNSSRHQRFMQETFLKNEISENISQEFHDQWKIG